MRNPRTGIVEMEDLVPHEEVVHTDSYRYMMQPFGVDYGTFIIPSVCMRTYEFIGVYRQDPPRLPSDTLHLLELLFPHIQNALKIRRTIASVHERLQSAEGMLDLAEEACLLLGTSCHILFANAAAKQLLSNSDGLIVRGDKVTAEDPTQRRALQRLVAAAEDQAQPGGATTIERRNGKRALQVFVMPFRLEAVHRAGARVLLLVSDPDRTVNVPDMILRQLYGVTPAETELANGLLAGYSLDEIAVLRRVAPSTVRSQMKSLFSKTSTTCQTDLVRLLASLPKTAMRANKTTTRQQTARRRS
jgi:DNA-binding CsgD family transcriptional regulator